jgi:hypothetical protein
MRTTIRLDERLLTEAKKRAAEKGTTLTALIEDSLREALARRAHPVQRKKIRMITFGEGGLQPGVDLDDTSSLLDRMDGLDGAH